MHTKGPWQIEGAVVIDKHRNIVAVCPLRVSDSEKRLIAAAPELLEALKACEPWCNDKRAVVMAREAIAKAEGTK
jgi:hypothetical protein